MVEDIQEVKKCPECGSLNITHNDKQQQVICRDCGMIYGPMAPRREAQFEKAAGLSKD